jgi:hypothetical protein
VVPDSLTDALVAPAVRAEPAAWDAALAAARASVTAPVVGSGGRPGATPFRVTEHDVRTALAGDSAVAPPDTPFAWSSRTARRALGLAALRALVAGDVTTPLDAVRWRVAESSRLVRGGSHMASPLDRWVADLSPAGRAAVGAEAVTWCTQLWSGLSWERLGRHLVIGRDRWWDSPRSALLALRGRAEVRTDRSHLVVLSGPRRASVRAELALVLLVEALRSRSGPPGRVVGWWPDSGHLVRVEAEPAVLSLAADAVRQVLARGRPAAQPAA